MTNEIWPRIIAHVGAYHTGLVDDETLHAFWGLALAGTPLIPQGADRPDKAHNKAVVSVLRHNADMLKAGTPEKTVTHILFLDADHKHPAEIVPQLARAVREDPTRMVVAALNFRRSEPWDPCAYEISESGDSSVWLSWAPGVYPVSVTGMAAMLVAVECFDKIEWPFFGYDYSHADKMHWSERHDLDDMESTKWPGVDVWFCKRCKDAGVAVYVDTRVKTSPHLGKLWIDDSLWRRFQGTERFKWHHAAYASRLERLREVAPDLFSAPGRVLYVGANRHRAHYADELKEAGNILDLLEVVPDFCEYWKGQGLFRAVYEGDVRNPWGILPSETRYDHAVWWHGPEHIPAEDLAATLQILETRVKPGGLVVLGCPWGDGPDGESQVEANRHVAAYDCADFYALGYEAIADGMKDSDASSLIAWKRVTRS